MFFSISFTQFTWFLLLEWVVRIVMLFVVSGKRVRPSSTNAWLLLIMIFPFLGSVIYFMFGNPKLSKPRILKRQNTDRFTKKELSKLKLSQPKLFAELENQNHQTLANLSTYLGSLPPMSGNKVDFLNDYDDVFRAMASELDYAQKYIHVEYFIAVLDDSTKPFFDALLRAVGRGVTVRFLYDKVASQRYKGHKAMRTLLKASGIEFHEMLPLSLLPGKNFTRPDLRNHRKLVIIDGIVAFSGSQNLIKKSYSRRDDIVYAELVVRLEGPVVWQCNSVFRSDWYAETSEKLLGDLEESDISKSSGTVIAQVLPSGPSHEHENNLKFYTSMVHAAKQRIGIVVPYFIPDESFLDALTAAAQRGVEVTVVNSEAIDRVSSGHAQRSYYSELLEAGIQLYLYKKPVFLHTKQVLIDDEVAIIGSSNLDIRSFELDFEVNIILYDKKVVSELDKIEQKYILESVKVTEKEWSKRSTRLKMLDNISRLTAALQ